MKIWLNDLKEGDEFYYISAFGVLRVVHCGDAHNRNFRMSRIKIKVVDSDSTIDELEAFVNQYVYTEEKEAVEEYLKTLLEKRDALQEKADDILDEIKELDRNIEKQKEKL